MNMIIKHGFIGAFELMIIVSAITLCAGFITGYLIGLYRGLYKASKK